MSTLVSEGLQLSPSPAPAEQGGLLIPPQPRDARLTKRTFQRYDLYVTKTGAQINSALPVLTRIAQKQFDVGVMIKELDIAASLLTINGQLGVALVEDTQLPINISLDGHGAILGKLLTVPGPNPALAVPVTRQFTIVLPNEGLFLPQGASISVYASSANDAGNSVLVSATITYELA